MGNPPPYAPASGSSGAGATDSFQWKPLAVSLALAAVAAVVSYIALTRGFPLFDSATSTLDTFSSGFLIFTGASFGVVSLANVVWGIYKSCMTEGEEYTAKEMKYQIGGTLLAPIGGLALCFIPIVMCSMQKR